MGLFSRFFHRDEPPRTRLRNVELRLEDLEAALEHTQSQLKKLRGRVTGGLRTGDAAEPAQDPPQPMIEPAVIAHSQEIENGRLLASLRGKRGILQG